MTELTHLTHRRGPRRPEGQDASPPPNSPRPISRRSRRRGRSTPMCWRRPRRRSPWPRPRTRSSAEARAARSRAFRSASRICSAPKAWCRPPARNILDDFKPPYESTVTPEPVGRRRGDARQAQHGRVRHGLVERDQRLRPGGLALAARGLERERGPSRRHRGHASGARAARRAARPRRSRPISASARPPPIPAARSASRRPSPAPSASSRPMAAARAGASSPSPPRSTRPGRSPATVRDAAIMLRSMAGRRPEGHDLASTCRCRTSRRRSRAASRA